MRIILFYHSLISDWNHGNAHFLRGIVSELLAQGHQVEVYEPEDGWSLTNLRADQGEEAVQAFYDAYPKLQSQRYTLKSLDLNQALDGADLIIVHEWSSPELVARVGEYRAKTPALRLLFHDTHHRSVSDPAAIARYDLRHYDGVLAFGEVIRQTYLDNDWADHAWTWHEAADTRVFRPLSAPKTSDLIWIGNWGDGERSDEIREFILDPVQELGLNAAAYGVRYPKDARAQLKDAGIDYRGWVANFKAPELFAAHRFTVHVPRQFYTRALPGIPTIRLFEAMACAIPLLCAPWDDAEGLFRPGVDYLTAENTSDMKANMRDLLHDHSMAHELARNGLETILAAHTCAHRVEELMRICRELGLDEAELNIPNDQAAE